MPLNSAQALDNALQPDRAGQFADARRNTPPVWLPHSVILLK